MNQHQAADGKVRAVCLVHHGDGYGGCLRCVKCGAWIRPQNLETECEETFVEEQNDESK